ncbi:MAG: hypothetical protein U0263_00495 [Polyangiaceae bacterium]
MSPAAFDESAYRALALALEQALSAQREDEVLAAAAAMRVSRYAAGVGLPFEIRFPPNRPFTEAFPSATALWSAAGAGVPEAFETAFEVLSHLDPERCASLAERAAMLDLWPEAIDRVAFALSRSVRLEPFRALLDLVGRVPRAGFLLTSSPCDEGERLVQAALEASSVSRYRRVEIPSSEVWQAMSEAEREHSHAEQAERAAAFSATDVNRARGLLEYLGVRGCIGALAIVMRLYAEHPSDTVRLAAGHALLGLADANALRQMIVLGDSSDSWRRWFGVHAAIALDPATAVERLGGRSLTTDARREQVRNAFEILKLDAERKQNSGEARWNALDPSWREVILHWIGDRELGAFAEVAGAGLTELLPPRGAKPRAKKRVTPERRPADAPRKPARGSALAHYRRGDADSASAALAALGPDVRHAKRLPEAREVARGLMLDARVRFEAIAEKLSRSGYRFARPRSVLVAPAPDVVERLDELESLVGELPVVLRAAFQHLGVIDLAGQHPSWPKSAHVALHPTSAESDVWFTDPFVFAPVEEILGDVEGAGRRPGFSVAVSGDAYTKAGYSGGRYSVHVPCLAWDAPLEGYAGGITFLEYLRLSLRFGGFAGFASIEDRPLAFLEELE